MSELVAVAVFAAGTPIVDSDDGQPTRFVERQIAHWEPVGTMAGEQLRLWEKEPNNTVSRLLAYGMSGALVLGSWGGPAKNIGVCPTAADSRCYFGFQVTDVAGATKPMLFDRVSGDNRFLSPDANSTTAAREPLPEFSSYSYANWDSEGARPIDINTRKWARAVLTLLGHLGRFVDLAPGADGSIGMEWYNGERKVWIDVGPAPVVTIYYNFGHAERRQVSFDLASPELASYLRDVFSRFQQS